MPADAGAPRACAEGSDEDGGAGASVAPCVEDCDRGIALACRVAAERLERHEHDPGRAVALLERACSLGDAAGCAGAARLVGRGVGTRPDRARQIELLSRACLLGDGLACAAPTRVFTLGDERAGIAKDPRRAASLREKACLAGIEEACEALADAGP